MTTTTDTVRTLLDDATASTTQALQQANGATQRGLHAMQDRGQHLLDQAQRTGERTAVAIQESPLKSMLVAAAAGAALMALVSLMGRGRNRP